MKMKNLSTTLVALFAVFAVGLGCSQVQEIANKAAEEANKEVANRAKAANTATASNTSTATSSSSRAVNPGDTADFTFTAEEIYKIYDKDDNADDKYANKIVAVKGRFMEIDTDKKDTEGGYAARLKAGDLFDWVNCSVDESEKEAFMALKEDQMVTVKGLGESFWIGGPRFKHCVIVP